MLSGPVDSTDGTGLARDADLIDALDRLGQAKGRARRHLTWAVLGVSPLALVPLLGLLAESSWDLLVLLTVLVVGLETWRHARARGDVRAIELEIASLRDAGAAEGDS